MPNLSTSDKNIAGLDHLRSLAITMVFLFHYRLFDHPAWIDTVGSFGWTGVDLFFVLSGYLIASQVFKNLQAGSFSLKEFYIKRSFRILPAYWLMLAVYFLFPAIREWEGLSPAWKFLSFTQNFGLDLRHYRTFSHAWSLCIEEQFYLVFPLIALILARAGTGRKSIIFIVAVFSLGFILRAWSWTTFVQPAIDNGSMGLQWYKWIYYPTYNRMDGLLVGISIAALLRFNPRAGLTIEKHANGFFVAGVVLLCAAWYLCNDQMSFAASVFGYPLIALAFGCMVASAASSRSILNKSTSRLSSIIATLSYTIYLSHKVAIHITQAAFAKMDFATGGSLMFIASLMVALACAVALHYSIEKPFLLLRRKLLKRSEAIAIPQPILGSGIIK